MNITTFVIITVCTLGFGFQTVDSQTSASNSPTNIESTLANTEAGATNYLSKLKSQDLATCNSALVKIRNEGLDSTEVRNALAELLSDPRPGGRILEDVAALPPRIEAAKLLAKRIGYAPLASKRPLAITEDDVKAFREWVAANSNKLIKEEKNKAANNPQAIQPINH